MFVGPRVGPISGPMTGPVAAGDVPSLVLLSSNIVGLGDVVATWPAGHQPRDVAILEVQTSNEAVTAPAGWTQIGAQQGIGAAASPGSTRLARFWRRSVGNMPPSTIVDPGDHCLAKMMVYRGVRDSGDPVDVQAGDTAASASAVSIPGATTTGPNRLVVAACADSTDATGTRFSGAANGSLTDVVEQLDFGTIQGTGGGISVVTGTKRTAGAYGATTGTLTPAAAQARSSVALRPRE